MSISRFNAGQSLQLSRTDSSQRIKDDKLALETLSNASLNQSGDAELEALNTPETREKYLQKYIEKGISEIQNGLTTPGVSQQQKMEWVQSAIEMLKTEFGEDPTMGGTDWGVPQNYQPSYLYQPTFPISKQNEAEIFSTDGTSATFTATENDPEEIKSRTIHFYQENQTLIIPSNAADVKVEQSPDKNSITVKIKLTDGRERTVVYHDTDPAKRPNFQLNIKAANPTRVEGEEGVSSIVLTGLEEGQQFESGEYTPPDKTDSTSRTWNTNDQVSYLATKGTQIDKIFASRVDITLPARDYKAEVYKTADRKYTILIKDPAGEVIRTIQTEQATTINFGKASRDTIFYAAGAPGTPTTPWNLETPQDTAIHIGIPQPVADGELPPTTDPEDTEPTGPQVGQSLHPKYENDTGPTALSGTTATYENSDASSETVIHPNFDDAINTHEITTTGTVKIPKAAVGDTYNLSVANGKYVLTLTGKDSKGVVKEEKFIIDGTRAKFVDLDEKPTGYNSLGYVETARLRIGTDGIKWLNDLPLNISTQDDHWQMAKTLVEEMTRAGVSGDWKAVSQVFTSTGDWLNPGHANDAIRNAVSAIYFMSGKNSAVYNKLLAEIPNEIKRLMVNGLSIEGNEKGKALDALTTDEVKNDLKRSIDNPVSLFSAATLGDTLPTSINGMVATYASTDPNSTTLITPVFDDTVNRHEIDTVGTVKIPNTPNTDYSFLKKLDNGTFVIAVYGKGASLAEVFVIDPAKVKSVEVGGRISNYAGFNPADIPWLKVVP